MVESGLTLDEVTFRHRGAGDRPPVLHRASARFLPGHMTLLRGAIGAGKSTTLHLLGALLRPTSGEVRAEGEPTSRWIATHRDRWRREVGIVTQRPERLRGLTVLENVVVGAIPRARSLSELRQEGRRALSLAGAEALAGRLAEELSGGEMQRAALARALFGRPRYLLLDEPAAHQDEAGLEAVERAIEAARGWGAVVVVASHGPGLTPDRTIELEGGQLLERR